MERQQSFHSVLIQSDDRVLVRQLLEKHVPAKIKQLVLTEYNKEAARRERYKNNKWVVLTKDNVSKTFESQVKAATELGVSRSAINNALTRKGTCLGWTVTRIDN